MNWLKAFLTSSVGRKFLMGITGLFLCFFLVVHLSGNLLLYVGAEAYNDYAHKLHSNEELLMIAETLLFGAFAVHIYLAFVLTIENKKARSKSYALKETKIEGRSIRAALSPDNTMFITGFIALLFLIVHIYDFKLDGWNLGEENPAGKAMFVVSHFSRLVIYLLGCVALGYHVSHGLGSGFQSIGFNHPKYTPFIQIVSKLFGIVVAIGFGSFPIMGQLMSSWKDLSP